MGYPSSWQLLIKLPNFLGMMANRINVQFVNGYVFNVTDRLFPTALREVQTDLSRRPVIVGVLALGLLLGISGPFDTLNVLSAGPRIVYWIAVVALTFATGSAVGTIVHTALDRRVGWSSYAVSTLAVGVSVTVVLSLINLIVFGAWFATWFEFLGQLGIVTLISSVVEFSCLALRTGTTTTPTARPPLLDRMPFERRGEIVALSAEDHYVRVTTTKGTQLVLMRLSDAVKEVGDTDGLQIHRSHWIATNQVKEVKRIGERAEVQSSDGSTRPISRSYMNAARSVGLFPSK
jgi:riboflavin transporter FmnP